MSANVSAISGLPILIRANGDGNRSELCHGNSNYNYAQRANQYLHLKIVNRSLNHWFGTDPSALPCKTPGGRINAMACPAPTEYLRQTRMEISSLAMIRTALNAVLEGKTWICLSSKAFRTVGNQYFKLRIDAYNAFNIASYAPPPNSRAGQRHVGHYQQYCVRAAAAADIGRLHLLTTTSLLLLVPVDCVPYNPPEFFCLPGDRRERPPRLEILTPRSLSINAMVGLAGLSSYGQYKNHAKSYWLPFFPRQPTRRVSRNYLRIKDMQTVRFRTLR